MKINVIQSHLENKNSPFLIKKKNTSTTPLICNNYNNPKASCEWKPLTLNKDTFVCTQEANDSLIKTYTVLPNQQVSFGYSNILKTLWKQGDLPTVTKGIYGGILTKDTISLEHIIPHKFPQGKSKLWNFALSTIENNNKRGCSPLKYFLDPEAFIEYTEQFKGVKIEGIFDGDEYVKNLIKTVITALREGK